LLARLPTRHAAGILGSFYTTASCKLIELNSQDHLVPFSMTWWDLL
jgi:hypothetical protein